VSKTEAIGSTASTATTVSTTPNSSTTQTLTTSGAGTVTYTNSSTIVEGVTKNTTAKVTAVYPMYFGGNTSSTLDSAKVLALTKQTIKTSPAGSYSVAVTQGQYMWLCVPSTMTINKVTSSGFAVPMESAVSVTVSGKGTYKCYRSSSTYVAGTVSIVIS